MIAKRPIYYTILPSLVIIVGYIWYRRKRNGRVDCDTGGDTLEKKSCNLVSENLADKNQELGNNSDLASASSSISLFINNQQQQHSLPIGTPQQKKKVASFDKTSTPEKEEASSLLQQNQSPSSAASNSSSSSSLCKSAPIDIAPNPRSPPKRITEQELDCEILKLKPQESEFEKLRYIEEPDSDLDTPLSVDSPPYRTRFNMNRTQSATEAVKIVKGTVEAKISPDNTFRERKYTQTESDDIENNNKMVDIDEVPKQQQQHVDSANNSNEDEEIKEATEIPLNNNNNSNHTQPQIASPSLSICSMHSGDSGQGSSPPQSIGAPTITYEFLVPNNCVGFIIGMRGNTIARIKEKTGATVVIRPMTHGSRRQKVCSIEGTQSEIDAALKMIKQVVPEKRSYNMNMERVFLTPDNKIVPTFNISSLQLHLIEGINNDVSISSVISGGHIFVQQPLHPTFPSLAILQQRMNHWYSIGNAPELPDLIDNAICAYFIQDNWYRVQIVSHNTETKICVIKYLDFGGYTNVNASELRQIHADFMILPFQAIECVLGNIRAPGGGEWSKESVETILSFTNGVILQAQISGYTQDDIPEVLLFVSISKDNVLFINQELCARNLAEWVDQQEVV
ncbi:hypothetical protein PVAND_000713 [Polypedilum vanderplanki]|uniref:Tudor domain-containing protein n=1 Tax=Polypedilum vanderplanki TaxID=319348 RepID=A0A9J6BKP4_POLVA|nr:hypothetical protein PVAND_000713 [Polypedilum vanderplanki]